MKLEIGSMDFDDRTKRKPETDDDTEKQSKTNENSMRSIEYYDKK